MRSFLCVAAAVAAAVTLFTANAQSTDPYEPPPIVLYHFIRGAAQLGHRADELDGKDGTGAALRAAFTGTIGLEAADAKLFLSFAEALDERFAALDREAAKTIADATDQRTADGLIPPPPPELRVLQQQKNTLRMQLNELLSQSALTENGKTALRGYLMRLAHEH